MSPEKRKDASNSSVFKDASDAGLRVQPTVPETVRFNARTVRGRLVEALRYDLLGPEHPDEILRQSPATRYLVGMLAPQGTEPDPVEDEEVAALTDGAEDPEPPAPAALALTPSSIGLSFVVARDCRSLLVTASWGEYAKRRREKGASAEGDDTDTDDVPDVRKKKPRMEYDWHRA